MSMIVIGTTEDDYGRPCEIYLDTDDMTNEDYYEYCKARDEEERILKLRQGNKSEALYKLLGAGTREQLTNIRKRKRAILNKYK